MRRRIVAGLAALVLAFSLTACGDPEEQECVDRNGTRYVCEDDDSDWSPVFIPWLQPNHLSKPKAPSYKAPSYKAPAYRAPAPAYRAPSYSYRSK